MDRVGASEAEPPFLLMLPEISFSRIAPGLAFILIALGIWLSVQRHPSRRIATTAPVPIAKPLRPAKEYSENARMMEERDVLLTRAATALSEKDPAKAVQLVLENASTEPLRSDLIIDIFDEWATSAPFDAARYAQSLSAGDDRANAIYVVADRWTKENPTSAYIWMKGLPEFDTLHLVVFEASP